MNAVSAAALPPAFKELLGDTLLPRPLFVAQRELTAFSADLLAFFDLITSLPERLFGGDLDDYCAALRIAPRQARLLRRHGGGAPPRYARADVYHDGTAFRLLEFNIASALGGIDRAVEIPKALLKVDAFRAFATEHGLTYDDTGRHVAEALSAAGRAVSSTSAPVVALLDGPGGMDRHGDFWRAFQELVCGFGLELHLGEIAEIRDLGGKLHLRGKSIDVIVRSFSVDQICAEPDGESLVEPIFRAHERGTVVLWTPMESGLFGNKGCLAMLSDPANRTEFSAAELALIDRILPWTRAVSGATDHGTMADLMDRRGDLILKPNARFGGAGIVAGWETDPDRWRESLTAAAEIGYVAQQRVRPRLEPVIDPETGQVGQWEGVWGMFVTPAGYAGTFVRTLPAHESAVIGVGANPATRTAGVFVYPSAD
ncbi:hypothetical protein [Nocardioides speluncae]|uniref:hypothetical protein n=1 Tax=Nocardioides speluncae TaxID=2670337 RepID=UPI000D694E8D|nr:hypothetical protein [Nocardioides speluncae]